MASFDQERVGCAIASALAGPGGIVLVVKVFCGVPGVRVTPARRGLFRSQPERVQIGDWRYELAADGRLGAAHLVNGVVIAEEVLAAGAVGPHIARALGQAVTRFGATIIPQIDAAVAALEAGTGTGF